MATGVTWHSQAGQDKWVVDQLGERPGFFVDVGAHDGLVHSNTYTLEMEYGWRGLCIEPNEAARKELAFNRSTVILPFIVSDVDGVVPFDGVRVGVGAPIQCRPLDKILDLYAPPVIDYLSIDVEGHELAVLAGMDFDRWYVRLITIEHNRYCDGTARKDAIFDRLTAAGFDRVAEDVVAPGYGEYEDWFVHL